MRERERNMYRYIDEGKETKGEGEGERARKRGTKRLSVGKQRTTRESFVRARTLRLGDKVGHVNVACTFLLCAFPSRGLAIGVSSQLSEASIPTRGRSWKITTRARKRGNRRSRNSSINRGFLMRMQCTSELDRGAVVNTPEKPVIMNARRGVGRAEADVL